MYKMEPKGNDQHMPQEPVIEIAGQPQYTSLQININTILLTNNSSFSANMEKTYFPWSNI